MNAIGHGNLLLASCTKLGEPFLVNMAKCPLSGKVDFSLHVSMKHSLQHHHPMP